MLTSTCQNRPFGAKELTIRANRPATEPDAFQDFGTKARTGVKLFVGLIRSAVATINANSSSSFVACMIRVPCLPMVSVGITAGGSWHS